MNAFRRSLFDAMDARGAKIDLASVAAIDTACHWLRHLLLAARWLRIEHDKLSPADRLAFSREVARAAVERDKCIRLLKLDKTALELFDPASIYRDGLLTAPADETASNAATERLNGDCPN